MLGDPDGPPAARQVPAHLGGHAAGEGLVGLDGLVTLQGELPAKPRDLVRVSGMCLANPETLHRGMVGASKQAVRTAMSGSGPAGGSARARALRTTVATRCHGAAPSLRPRPGLATAPQLRLAQARMPASTSAVRPQS